jgi:HTH-type transcriptional regulator / antitoxin HigA
MTKDIRPIRTDEDHSRALAEIETLWSAKPGTRAADRLEILSTLVEAYERLHHSIDPPDPIEAIRFRMEQSGIDRRELALIIGSKTRASEILNRKRRLSLSMVRSLHARLGIPAEVLIREVEARPKRKRAKRKSIARS